MSAMRLEAIGSWTAERSHEVTDSAVRAYALATGETRREYLEGEVAPAVFAVVPAMPAMAEARSDLLPGIPRGELDLLHVGHELTIEQPIRAGAQLRTTAAVVGVAPKSVGSLLIIETRSSDAAGALFNSQRWTLLLRGRHVEQHAGVAASTVSDAAPGERCEVGRVSDVIDPGQAGRYAAASGDYGPYHLDAEAARAAGFPGPILHGLCTLAIGMRAVADSTCDGDQTRVREIGARFSRPVSLNATIVTTVWADAGPDEGFGFEIVDGDQRVAVRDGRAVLARQREATAVGRP